MSGQITRKQLEQIEDARMCCDVEEYNKVLEEITGITAAPFTAYSYYDSDLNYLGDTENNTLEEIMKAAYIEVIDE